MTEAERLGPLGVARYLSPAWVADALGAGRMTEREKAGVVLATSLLYTFLGSASHLGTGSVSLLVLSAIHVLTLLLGFRACYRANARGDGRNFVERYICLTLPVTVCVYVPATLAYYAAYFALRDRYAGTAAYYRAALPYTLLAAVPLGILFFLLLRGAIRRAAAGAQAES